MKKLSIFLAVLFSAVVMTSCVKPYENEISLALDNLVVAIPKTLDGKDPIHYAKVTSTGSWEATIETSDGSTWCWIEVEAVDQAGNMKPVAGIKALEYSNKEEGMASKIQGTGSVYVPIGYGLSNGGKYAVFSVYRADTGERCTMQLRQ